MILFNDITSTYIEIASMEKHLVSSSELRSKILGLLRTTVDIIVTYMQNTQAAPFKAS